jgi:hypothetical protein
MFLVRRSVRCRSVSIAILPGGSVRVTAHPLYPEWKIREFLAAKEKWILRKVEQMKGWDPDLAANTKAHFLEHKERAEEIVKGKVAVWKERMGCAFNRCTVRRQKRSWGTCSKKGNLNFNYKICFLPEELQDYVVVHELCHLKELNHSPRFWRLMEQYLPNAKSLRRALRHHR